ncbi:hypothetical protein [Saccharopolyspora sp. NPDC002376]
MTLTVAQVRAAHDAGYAAGKQPRPPLANPYAAPPLKPWEAARLDPAARAEHDRQTRERRALARVWRVARRKALDER